MALISQLRMLANVDIEVFTLVPHKRLRWTHSVFRTLKGHPGWPQELEQQVEGSLSKTSFVSYAPLPKATIESATVALAIELIRRPVNRRPRILYGANLDLGGFAAVQVAKSISCASVVLCDQTLSRAESEQSTNGDRRQRIALRDADQIISLSHELSAEIAKAGRRTEFFSLTQNDPNEQNYWSQAQATLETVHRNVLG